VQVPTVRVGFVPPVAVKIRLLPEPSSVPTKAKPTVEPEFRFTDADVNVVIVACASRTASWDISPTAPTTSATKIRAGLRRIDDPLGRLSQTRSFGALDVP
jgi:hypothetical protein